MTVPQSYPSPNLTSQSYLASEIKSNILSELQNRFGLNLNYLALQQQVRGEQEAAARSAEALAARPESAMDMREHMDQVTPPPVIRSPPAKPTKPKRTDVEAMTNSPGPKGSSSSTDPGPVKPSPVRPMPRLSPSDTKPAMSAPIAPPTIADVAAQASSSALSLGMGGPSQPTDSSSFSLGHLSSSNPFYPLVPSPPIQLNGGAMFGGPPMPLVSAAPNIMVVYNPEQVGSKRRQPLSEHVRQRHKPNPDD